MTMKDPVANTVLPPLAPSSKAFTIATISAGFEKGDFLVREEQGARIYFDFVSSVQLLCCVVVVCVVVVCTQCLSSIRFKVTHILLHSID